MHLRRPPPSLVANAFGRFSYSVSIARGAFIIWKVGSRAVLKGKEKWSVTQFPPKSPRALHVFNHGWWRLAVGGWRRFAVGSWRFVVVGSGWQLVVGSRWRLAVGGWRLVAVAGRWSLGAVLKGGP